MSGDADEAAVLAAVSAMWPDFDFSGCYDLSELLNHAAGQLAQEREDVAARLRDTDDFGPFFFRDACLLFELPEGSPLDLLMGRMREAVAAEARLRDTEQGDGKQSRETPASAGDVGTAASLRAYFEAADWDCGKGYVEEGEPYSCDHCDALVALDALLGDLETARRGEHEMTVNYLDAGRLLNEECKRAEKAEARVEHLTTALREISENPFMAGARAAEALRVAAGGTDA